MSSIQDFTKWKKINEQKLDIDSKSSKKQNRKANKRSNRKSTYLSDSGVEFALIKRKSDGDSNTDAYILKSKNKDSKIWDAKGVITADVDSFLQDELFGGTTEGKYDEESIELEEYKQGARKDNVNFTVKLADKEAKKKKEVAAAAAAVVTTDLYKAITIPENDEGEKRIEIGQESAVLPEIKEILRKSYIKQGLKLPTQTFGVSWLDASKLEDIDSQWIKMIRAGFKMKSADYITQGFVKNMVDQANLWNNAPKAVPAEGVKKEAAATAPTKDVASNESLLFSFSGFIKVNEEFDMAAANAAANAVATESKPKSEASSKKSSSSGGSGSSGLTNAQASAYRTWANSHDKLKKDYGQTGDFDLDPAGNNNSFVKRSYTKAKSDYDAGIGNLIKKWSNDTSNGWRTSFAKATGLSTDSKATDKPVEKNVDIVKIRDTAKISDAEKNGLKNKDASFIKAWASALKIEPSDTKNKHAFIWANQVYRTLTGEKVLEYNPIGKKMQSSKEARIFEWPMTTASSKYVPAKLDAGLVDGYKYNQGKLWFYIPSIDYTCRWGKAEDFEKH